MKNEAATVKEPDKIQLIPLLMLLFFDSLSLPPPFAQIILSFNIFFNIICVYCNFFHIICAYCCFLFCFLMYLLYFCVYYIIHLIFFSFHFCVIVISFTFSIFNSYNFLCAQTHSFQKYIAIYN